MTIYRRRLASSFQALEKTLVNRLQLVDIKEEDLSSDEMSEGGPMDAEEANKLAKEAAASEEPAEI